VATAALAALSGLHAAGCATRVPETHELLRPVYSWSWSRGACGGRRALDGEGTVWVEEGCEDGHPKMTRGPRASVAQRAAIVDAFTRFPEPAETTCGEPPVIFQIDAGGRVRTWSFCDGEDPSLGRGAFAEATKAFGAGATP
jgi:hypothetical protein